jgi:hypothetical protein
MPNPGPLPKGEAPSWAVLAAVGLRTRIDADGNWAVDTTSLQRSCFVLRGRAQRPCSSPAYKMSQMREILRKMIKTL